MRVQAISGLVGLIIATSSASTWGAVIAGPVINPANQHEYYLLEKANWTTSASESVELGGHLATVNDAAENAWLYQTFAEGTGRSLWIGLNDAAVEGQFVWASGEPVTYTNWDTGSNQPDNLNPDNYVILWPPGAPFGGTSSKWNDMPNESDWFGLTMYGVAEVVPEPSGLAMAALAATSLIRRRRQPVSS